MYNIVFNSYIIIKDSDYYYLLNFVTWYLVVLGGYGMCECTI